MRANYRLLSQIIELIKRTRIRKTKDANFCSSWGQWNNCFVFTSSTIEVEQSKKKQKERKTTPSLSWGYFYRLCCNCLLLYRRRITFFFAASDVSFTLYGVIHDKPQGRWYFSKYLFMWPRYFWTGTCDIFRSATLCIGITRSPYEMFKKWRCIRVYLFDILFKHVWMWKSNARSVVPTSYVTRYASLKVENS